MGMVAFGWRQVAVLGQELVLGIPGIVWVAANLLICPGLDSLGLT